MVTSVVVATAVAKVPTEGDLTELFTILSKAYEEELADRIEDFKHIQVAELAMSNFGRTKGLAADWRNASPISVAYLLDPPSVPSEVPNGANPKVNTDSSACLPSHSIPSTRAALSPEAQIELDFWRSVARKNDLSLYASYLRYYPSGTFASIANAKISAMQVAAKASSATKKRTSVAPLEPKKRETLWSFLKAHVGTEARCRGGNSDRCAATTKKDLALK
ncbi:MAG TPA: hypothetical protein VH933_17400 [Aestuariivirgaceae bacterium]|jgi:hypothetical protein